MERHAHRLLDGSFDEEARQEQQAGQSEYDNKKHDDNAEETDDEEGGDNDTAMSGTDENHKEGKFDSDTSEDEAGADGFELPDIDGLEHKPVVPFSIEGMYANQRRYTLRSVPFYIGPS